MSSLKWYAVTGYGFFPVSMLDWDGAEPVNDEERRRMLKRHIPYAYGNKYCDDPMKWTEFMRQVYLVNEHPTTVCLMTDRKGGPDIKRWNEFGWIVTDVLYMEDGSMAADLTQPWSE